MNEYDDLTSRLTRTLTDHSDVMTGSSLGLAEVTRRARSIRRRRTAAAVAGVAAAVAVIIPTVALASHTGGSPEPAPATQTPTPTATVTATDGAPPLPGVLDVSDLPTGEAPAMDYVYQGSLHFADGGTGTVRTRYAPDQFVEMDDGSRVWHTSDQGTPYVEIQDADGTFHDPVPSGWDVNVNPSHTIAAWLAPTGQVTVWEGRASEPRPLGDPIAGSDLRLGPVTGDRCALACSVVVNVSGANGRQPWEVSDSGSRELRDGGYLIVDDISRGGLTIGHTKVSDGGSCSKLLGGGEFQGFATCQNQFAGFSPDGQLLLAEPPYYDGPGPSGIAMYDLSGTSLFERGATAKVQSFYAAPAVWEDDTHVLAATYQDGTWALVRIASDGTMEYAVAPQAGPYEDSPYVLPTGGDLASLDS
jgi:hypothetical protein